MVALGIATLGDNLGAGWISHPPNHVVAQWIAETSIDRHEGGHDFAQTGWRYDERNERRLNIAEHIGKLVLISILEKKFEGVQTDQGLLKQLSDHAREHNISGAKDLDTLRAIWKMYRGVVHLGMAIDFCEDYPDHTLSVLDLAETTRQKLSHFCPKGTKKPYVDESEQIMFSHYSMT